MLLSAYSAVTQFVAREDGPTAVEYSVLVALIIIACIVAIGGFGTALSNWYVGATPTVAGLRTTP